jgi:hypothetical protein
MAAFFPRSQSKVVHRRNRSMQMQTEAGPVKLEVSYGQDATGRHWGCPIRERWGLTTHQQLSLALEDKLAFTITATASYEEAAALAQKWGVPVTDSLLHQLTRRLGSRAEAQKQEHLKTPPPETESKRAPAKLGVLMLDGWQVRQRGPGWGRQRTKKNRVEWHEWKTGGVLSAGKVRPHCRWTRGHHRQVGHRLARRPGGVWPTIALGGFAWRTGAGTEEIGGGGRSRLDLEHGPRPLAGSHRNARLLPRQRTPVVPWTGPPCRR